MLRENFQLFLEQLGSVIQGNEDSIRYWFTCSTTSGVFLDTDTKVIFFMPKFCMLFAPESQNLLLVE